MQYIECVHCHKRYAANQKLKDAMGTKVRCAECGASFPIVIHDADPLHDPASDRATPDQT